MKFIRAAQDRATAVGFARRVSSPALRFLGILRMAYGVADKFRQKFVVLER